MASTETPRTTKGRAPHRRNEDARLAVLHAADDLLVERGFDAITIEGIAARAGVAKQTIYRWWPSKVEILLDTLIDDADRRLVLAPHGSTVEGMRRFLRTFTRFLTREPAGRVMLALLGQVQHDPAFGKVYRERFLEPMRQRELAFMRRGIAAGELVPELDPDVVLDALKGPIILRAMTGRPIPRAFVDELIDNVLIPRRTGAQPPANRSA